MNFISFLFLSTVLLLGLTACSPAKESQATVEPQATEDQNTQTSEISNADSTEHVPLPINHF